MWNLFKVKSYCSYSDWNHSGVLLSAWTNFTQYPGVSIVDFEQVNDDWAVKIENITVFPNQILYSRHTSFVSF